MRHATLDRLTVDPELALLAVVDIALDMTARLLLVAHPPPDDLAADCHEHRLAHRLLTDADELRRSLADYLDLLDRNYAAPDSTHFPF